MPYYKGLLPFSPFIFSINPILSVYFFKINITVTTVLIDFVLKGNKLSVFLKEKCKCLSSPKGRRLAIPIFVDVINGRHGK